MLNLTRAEFYKLSKSTGAKICFLLACIGGAALIYVSHGIAIGNLKEDISRTASGLTEIMIVSLLGSLMIGFLICSDFETKTIHDAVACGNGRISIVLSKVLVYILVIMALLLPYAVATIIGLCSGVKFTSPFVASVFVSILADTAGKGITAAVIGKIVVLTVVTSLVHAARLSICIPIAFKIRKPVVIMAVGFALSILVDLLIGLLDDIPIVKDILAYTPFSRNFIILTMDSGTDTILKALGASILFIVAMAALTYSLFRRAEIK